MKSNKINTEIRKAIAGKGLRHYEVANALGVTVYTFSHWLQSELPEERKDRILKAIDNA